MKLIVSRIIIAILFLFAAVSCINDNERVKQIDGEIDVALIPGEWTYISIENGAVVGTGRLGDEESDAAWAGRDDWDIAICDSLIRTNGGKSGIGQGALSDVSSASTVPDSYQEIW
jgi:hypothetical protein